MCGNGDNSVATCRNERVPPGRTMGFLLLSPIHHGVRLRPGRPCKQQNSPGSWARMRKWNVVLSADKLGASSIVYWVLRGNDPSSAGFGHRRFMHLLRISPLGSNRANASWNLSLLELRIATQRIIGTNKKTVIGISSAYRLQLVPNGCVKTTSIISLLKDGVVRQYCFYAGDCQPLKGTG